MAAGDPAAIEAFYEQHFELMYGEARRCTGGDEATCLDIVQDAMLKALRSIPVIKTTVQLESWTRKLVRSVAVDNLRRSSRRLQRERKASTAEVGEDKQGYAEVLQARIIWLEESLTEMDETSELLIRLRYLRGWTLAKIARFLGLQTGAVDGRIRRLVKQLREQAEGFGHEH